MDSYNIQAYKTQLIEAQKSGDIDAFLKLSQKATQEFPSEADLKVFLHDAQAEYVNQKLESQILKDLETKRDYVTLHAVYQKLLEVFPESHKLQHLLKKVERKVEYEHSHQREMYIKAAKKKIHAWMKEKKWDEAYSACEELKQYAPKAKNLHHLLQKIKKRRNRNIEEALNRYFKVQSPLLKKAYQANPENFIRV